MYKGQVDQSPKPRGRGIDLLFLTCFPAVSYSFECVKINVTQILNVTFIIIPLTHG